MATWIPDDGYTESGYIAAIPNLHAAVRFKFRPMLAEQRAAWIVEREKLKPGAQQTRKGAELLAARTLEWDLKKENGEPIPPTLPNVLRLNPLLLARLVNIYCGVDAYDDDPDAPPAEAFDEAASAKN